MKDTSRRSRQQPLAFAVSAPWGLGCSGAPSSRNPQRLCLTFAVERERPDPGYGHPQATLKPPSGPLGANR
jgi:hypothetical protein